MERWILHIDMDAFFTSVEQLDFPELRGKPIVVGGENRGVVAAASYEARKFGIHSAMPSFKARKLCPHVLFIKHRKDRYAEKSHEVMTILQSFSPLVESASIDEAYLDLTGLEKVFGSVKDLAHFIQKTVATRTGLSCSVGLAPIKFLAKVASDLNKPGGVSILDYHDVPSFLQQLPIQKIPGVGKKTLVTLHSLGVKTAGDMQLYPLEFWKRTLGKAGEGLFEKSQGVDNRPVTPHTEPKSESAEDTFPVNILSRKELIVWLLRHSEQIGTNLRKQGIKGRTVTLKVKYNDFTQVTRSRTLKEATNSTKRIHAVACALLEGLNPVKPLRLIGVGLSQFGEHEERQLSLLESLPENNNQRDTVIDATIDEVRKKFGSMAVIRGALFTNKT